MYDRILRRMRDHIRKGDYVVTLHCLHEMVDDALTSSDIRAIVLTGRISERQRDWRTGEWKYLVDGFTRDGRLGTVVGKLGMTRRFVILTVYRW